MIELYWMAILRDVNFEDFSTNAGAAAAAAELSTVPLYSKPSTANNPSYETRTVTPATLFRGGEWTPVGATNPEHLGPYLSQFMCLNVPYGTCVFEQKERRAALTDYRVGKAPFMTDFNEWLLVQDGAQRGAPVNDLALTDARYIQNMGDLARYVHIDQLYEAYLNAALILLGAPGMPDSLAFDAGNPYEGTPKVFPKEAGFGTFGGPHIISLVCEAATRALKAVWYQKWIGNLRLRPEAYGGVVHRALEGVHNPAAAQAALGDGLALLQASNTSGKAVKTIHDTHGTFLLPMCFEEGSPTHPAYGAGHATVAGACVTVLKAFFAGTQKLVDIGLMPVIPTPDGKGTTSVGVADASELTIGGELDKLASNIAIGRNMAGVHWRTDYSQSSLLGQRVATSILYHQRRDYHEREWSFRYLSFGGKVVEIRQDGVIYDGTQILDGDDDFDPANEALKLRAII